MNCPSVQNIFKNGAFAKQIGKGIYPYFPRGGGHIVPPCHVFAYNQANTRTSVLKNLIFPNYEFGKGQYAIKISRFSKKK